jgi:hypothetical protein
LEKMEDGIANVFFIDPEHVVGRSKKEKGSLLPRRGDIRPRINAMYGATIDEHGDVPDIVALRYRSNEDSFPEGSFHKFGHQLDMARDLLAGGELPIELQEHEQEITFNFRLRDAEKSTAQARLTSAEQLESFLDDGPSSQAVNVHTERLTLGLDYVSKMMEKLPIDDPDKKTPSWRKYTPPSELQKEKGKELTPVLEPVPSTRE